MSKNAAGQLSTRDSLLIRLKDWDDNESWKDFFDTYWKLIYGVALKSGLTEQEAQEVVQETIVSVAKKMKEFKYDPLFGSFRGWLLQLTRWRINDQLRKRVSRLPLHHSRPPDETRTATIERVADPAPPELEKLWAEEWEKNVIDTALERVKRQVPPKQYQIFDLYVRKKWPAQKVSRTLQVSLAQVYLARHRVAKLVKREVERLEKDLF